MGTSISAFIFVAIFLTNSGILLAQELAQGECRCETFFEGQKGVSGKPESYPTGLCRYQAHENESVFKDLLVGAGNLHPDFSYSEGFRFEDRVPKRGTGSQRMIEWWYSDTRWNDVVCKYLKDNDHQFAFEKQRPIKIAISLFTFEQGSEREIGADFGSFYGKKSLEAERPKVANSLKEGIFQSALSLTGPWSSLLNVGIKASIDKHRADILAEEVAYCLLGSYCEPSQKKNNYILIGNMLEPKMEELGISFSGMAIQDPVDPKKIRIRDFNLRYGIPTGETTSPVLVRNIRSYLDLDLVAGETLVLGMSTTNRDARTGKLVSSATEKAFTQFLALIKVDVPSNSSSPVLPEKIQGAGDDRSFTEEELAELPMLSLKDAFNSIESVCFDDIIDSTGNSRICGFRFKKIDRRFVNYRLKLELKGKLKYGEEKVRYWKMGDIYDGKGYYQLPAMDETKAGKYTLKIQIDRPTPEVKSQMDQDGVSGMRLDFNHYPKDHRDPITYSPSSLEILK